MNKQVEEIKKEINEYKWNLELEHSLLEIIDVNTVFEILDKHNNQPDLKEDLKISLKETLTMQDLINQIKELQGFKSAFEELLDFYEIKLKDMYSKNDVMVLGRLKDLKKKYNLGGK